GRMIVSKNEAKVCMKSLNLARSVVASRCLPLGAYVLAFQPAASYHLLKKVSLGAAQGDGEYFDYISFDAAARRVYLSHGTEVKVVDVDSGAVVGNITGLKRDHGVVLVPELGRGFISDGDAGHVVIFDMKTLKTVGRVKGEKDADSIILRSDVKAYVCLQRRPQERHGYRSREGDRSGNPSL